VRIVVANRLRRHVVLTWARDVPDVEEAHRAVSRFLAVLRRDAFGGGRFPYAYVLGTGTKSSRLHVHVLLPATFPGNYASAWPHGSVKVFPADSVDEQRAVARYVAHHFDDCREPGQRRYRAPHGIAPKGEVVAVLDNPTEAVALSRQMMGWDPTEVVRSDGFAGSRSIRLSWDEQDTRDESTASRYARPSRWFPAASLASSGPASARSPHRTEAHSETDPAP